MADDKAWRFCVVGNIKKQHLGEEQIILYGTKAFVGGTKVYISDETFGLNDGRISVMGLNRFRRYAVESVPIDLIENVRLQRVFKPGVLAVMDGLAVTDGWRWKGRTTEDRKTLEAFVENWGKYQSYPDSNVDY